MWKRPFKVTEGHTLCQLHFWSKLGEIPFFGLWDMVFTRFTHRCLLWPWGLTFWSQNPISTFVNLNTSVTKMGEIAFIGFWDMVFTRFLGRTDSLTHSQTDRPDYRMPSAPFFNGGIKLRFELLSEDCRICDGTQVRWQRVHADGPACELDGSLDE